MSQPLTHVTCSSLQPDDVSVIFFISVIVERKKIVKYLEAIVN